VKLGVTLFDTQKVYGGPFINEENLVGEALFPSPQGGGQLPRSSVQHRGTEKGLVLKQPAGKRIRQCCQESSQAAKSPKAFDLFLPAPLDPNVPIETLAGTVKDLIRQGNQVKNFASLEVGAQNDSAAPCPFQASYRCSKANIP